MAKSESAKYRLGYRDGKNAKNAGEKTPLFEPDASKYYILGYLDGFYGRKRKLEFANKNPREIVRRNPTSGVRIVFNKLLGGWYVVRGPHQTPLNGRFDSKAEAQAWLDNNSLRRNPSRMKPRAAPIAATKTAADVARYLRSIKGKGAPTGVIPITLSVRGKTWQGARYVQSGSVRLYMIGDLPPAWRERKKTVFNIGRDLRDWYVAAHMSEPIAAQYAEFHPMGANFILIPWEVPGGESIDKYEAKPYTRVKAQIKRVK